MGPVPTQSGRASTDGPTTPGIRTRILGAGRAGGSFARALAAAGCPVELVARGADLDTITAGVDLVLLCVPDPQVAAVAAAIPPDEAVVVAHCAGSLGLDVLDPAPRRASIHPLVSLADPVRGAEALRGAWFAVSGDPRVGEVVDALGGRSIHVDERDRVRYHAAAVIASNHVVALMGQVERLARDLGVPPEAFVDLVRGAVDNVAALGAADALTGPVARGDWATVQRHLDELPAEERPAYAALADAAARLVGSERPVPRPERQDPGTP